MEVNIKFEDNLISDNQAETFAYNIYRDIAEYMKTNFEEFIWWNLDTISAGCVITINGDIYKNNNIYNKCNYEKGDDL